MSGQLGQCSRHEELPAEARLLHVQLIEACRAGLVVDVHNVAHVLALYDLARRDLIEPASEGPAWHYRIRRADAWNAR